MFCSKIFLVLLLGFCYFHVKRCVTNINQEEPWPKDKEELGMLPEKQQKSGLSTGETENIIRPRKAEYNHAKKRFELEN